ncbi:MAG: VanZ family protein [Bacteroidota bacterium]
MSKKKGLRAVLFLFGLGTILILVVTLAPSGSSLPKNFWSHDKLGHAAMFFCWTFFDGLIILLNTRKFPNVLLLITRGLIFGGLIEVLQYLIPTNRSPEWLDLLADGIGSLIGIVFLYVLYKWRFQKSTA